MKKFILYFFVFFVAIPIVFGFPTSVFAKITWHMQDEINLEDKPLAIAVAKDGTAYILCDKSIAIYAPREKKITDTIPITKKFSQIALTPDEQHLLLTNTDKKQVSIIEISQIYDIEIGQSPIIGKKDAPVRIFAFFDYQ